MNHNRGRGEPAPRADKFAWRKPGKTSGICPVEAKESIPGRGNQMSKELKADWRLLALKALGWGGMGGGSEGDAIRIVSNWVNDKIWIILWQVTIVILLRGPVILLIFSEMNHMPSKTPEGKIPSVSPLVLVVLGEGDEKLNTSSPFSPPV